jgi:hypothetical protein
MVFGLLDEHKLETLLKMVINRFYMDIWRDGCNDGIVIFFTFFHFILSDI